ncbi:hypothetical protein ACTZWW_00880 [Salinarimonas sp. NSM]|uniref:hypothetical protein n=1 Tax=Salinarimonas sp. NSM TaxID=3458003 RepID=UPI004036A68A
MAADDPPLSAKARFLSRPGAYAHRPSRVDVIETTLSFVFLAGPRVFKLKKPLISSVFDFSSVAKRETNCRAEAALNARLAEGVYFGVVPLTRGPGGLAIGGEGEAVDWLVVMRRLPASRMLDRTIPAGRVTSGEVAALGERLAAFYATAERPPASPSLYLERYARHIAEARALLREPVVADERAPFALALARLEARLAADRPLLETRARGGVLVDGHGDLRPEHVCLTDPIVVFDCLEFSDDLRIVDPFDEIAYLGLECRRLGAPAIGPMIEAAVTTRLGDRVSPRLVRLYMAARALLRARQCLAHLSSRRRRRARAWRPLTRTYLAIAMEALADT